jgi:hypothetical protein
MLGVASLDSYSIVYITIEPTIGDELDVVVLIADTVVMRIQHYYAHWQSCEFRVRV